MVMVHEGLIRPCAYEHMYKGLSNVPNTLNDLAARKIWGKGVISIGEDQSKALFVIPYRWSDIVIRKVIRKFLFSCSVL